jgi:glycosyltransferase involved in cell wall biosynthesis
MWGPAARLLPVADRLVGWSRWPTVISAVSSAAATPLRRLGLEVRVIPNGIDVARWRVEPLPREDGDEVVVVAVMRLAPRKRGLALLAALHAVRDRLPAAVGLRAVIVGEGPQRRRLERYLDRHGSPGMAGWVELPGRWESEAIRELYRRADLFVSATRLESFGIAALEARTAGVPVVAMAGSGVGEFVTHGVHGLLAADDAELAAAVLALAGDPARRAEMARAARAQPPPTSWDQVLRQCEQAYADAVTASRAASE